MVAAGRSHTCALMNDKTVQCWGSNERRQLGLDDRSIARQPTPTPISDLHGVTRISAGWDHTCAVMQDETVRCWGYNRLGELGRGETSIPDGLALPVLNLSGVTDVQAGALHTCALARDGAVWCWGSNAYGQLGIPIDVESSPTPLQVADVEGAIQVGTSIVHSCALLRAGTVVCWGTNGDGELGIKDELAGFQGGRVTVPGLDDVGEIAVGGIHTCALRNDLSVWCWGSNEFGQLGDGTVAAARATPMPVAGLTDGFRIVAGSVHTCAIVTDRAARCWGSNEHGQVGDGTTKHRSSPAHVLPF